MCCTKDGLVGSRAVGGKLWNVVEAMESAYPLLLSRAAEKARSTASTMQDSQDAQNGLADLWLRQVCMITIAIFNPDIPGYASVSDTLKSATNCLRSQFSRDT